MVQQNVVALKQGRGGSSGRLGKYFCIGAVLIVAALGLRKGVLWWNDPFRAIEKKVGFHLYQPTYIPYGMRLAENGVIRGAFRVVWAYSTDDYSVHVGQESRTPARDRYNRKEFKGQPVKVNGHPATFSRNSFGHWRLYWQTDDATLVLTSANVAHKEMVRIAESMR